MSGQARFFLASQATQIAQARWLIECPGFPLQVTIRDESGNSLQRVVFMTFKLV
jgi:hypothetical protein